MICRFEAFEVVIVDQGPLIVPDFPRGIALKLSEVIQGHAPRTWCQMFAHSHVAIRGTSQIRREDLLACVRIMLRSDQLPAGFLTPFSLTWEFPAAKLPDVGPTACASLCWIHDSPDDAYFMMLVT